MLINEIIDKNRRILLTAVEQWVSGVGQRDNLAARLELVKLLSEVAGTNYISTSPTLFRTTTVGKDKLQLLLNGKSIQVSPKGAHSFSRTLEFAKWFFDESAKINSIIFKKKSSSDAIIDILKLKATMTDEEKSEYGQLAFDNDPEVIVLDTKYYLTIHPNEIVQYK